MGLSITTNQTNHPTLSIPSIPLEKGKSLHVEPGSMHACKNIELTTRLNGSVWNAAKQYFLAGESTFINVYSAKENGAWLALEEEHRGQVGGYQLSPRETLVLQKGAYVASDSNVKIGVKFAGISSWFKGLGVWKITASVPDASQGRVFFDTKSGIIKAIKIKKEDGPVTVDNENIIGYTDSLKMTLKKLGNAKTFLFSGEGLVNEVSGDGTVFVGTTSIQADKHNYFQKVITSTIEGLSDGKLSSNGIALIAGLAIIATSRVAKDLFNLDTVIDLMMKEFKIKT